MVLLNLNVLMVSYGDGNDRSRKGFNEIGEHLISGDECRSGMIHADDDHLPLGGAVLKIPKC